MNSRSAPGGLKPGQSRAFRFLQSNRAVTVFLDLGPLSSYDPVVPNKNYKPGERLDVIVMDELGALISNASLTLRSGTNTLRTNSSPDGHFSFAHVRSGRSVLVVAATGFQTKTVEDVQVTREDAVPLRSSSSHRSSVELVQEELGTLDLTTGIPYYSNLNFEWNKSKAKANYVKHGVGFELAKRVFKDPFAVEVFGRPTRLWRRTLRDPRHG